MQNNTEENQNYFYQLQTNTFKLQVRIQQEDELSVQLENYIDWVVYKKVYTNQDVAKGIQINRRLKNVIDIYNIISRKVGKKDETRIEQMDQQNTIQSYTFGDIIKSRDTSCFKVENNGKVTVFFKLPTTIQNQDECNSQLKLQRVKQMSEIQIVTKQSHIDKLNLEKNIKQLQKTIKVNEEQSTKKFKKLEQAMKSMQCTQLNSLYPNIFTLTLNDNKFTVKYDAQNNAWTNYFFIDTIRHEEVCQFKVCVVKAVSRNIMIGVADYAKQKRSRNSYNSNNAIAYYGYTAAKYPGGSIEGIGFSQNQTVDVNVDRVKNIVRWSVDGQQRASYTHQMLGDQSRIFMPYVEFYNTDDVVQYIKQ